MQKTQVSPVIRPAKCKRDVMIYFEGGPFERLQAEDTFPSLQLPEEVDVFLAVISLGSGFARSPISATSQAGFFVFGVVLI